MFYHRPLRTVERYCHKRSFGALGAVVPGPSGPAVKVSLLHLLLHGNPCVVAGG